jgi:hypothetical protein
MRRQSFEPFVRSAVMLDRTSNALIAITILLGVAAASVGCVTIVGDGVGWVRVDGARYSGGPSTGFDIQANDLEWYTTATEIASGVEGNDVYRLAGTDPRHVVVMRSATPDAD